MELKFEWQEGECIELQQSFWKLVGDIEVMWPWRFVYTVAYY